MSGHSKWAQIKRQKGAADIKRGQMFTKLANAITIAVRQGGGITDPNSNFKLRLAIDRARSYNMPKENIDRVLERAQGKQEGAVLDEVVYEGFGPFQIAIIVEAVTDNKQRTAAELKNIFEKNGGTLAASGAVSYQFKQEGLITIKKNGKSFDEIFLIAADNGAEDVEDINGSVLVYTDPSELKKVEEVLSTAGLKIENSELTRRSLSTVQITDKEHARRIIFFTDKMEEVNDVQKVYSNFDISEEIINEIRQQL